MTFAVTQVRMSAVVKGSVPRSPTLSRMRWDRLFAELEAQVEDEAWVEREALVDELEAGEWADTSWRDLLVGDVALTVRGAGPVRGQVALATSSWVRLRDGAADVVVATSAVCTVRTAGGRASDPGPVTGRLGWGHVFRALGAEGDPVALTLVDGQQLAGDVGHVGADAVEVVLAPGRTAWVPWSALATVRSR